MNAADAIEMILAGAKAVSGFNIVIRVEVNGTTSIAIFSGILSLCEAN